MGILTVYLTQVFACVAYLILQVDLAKGACSDGGFLCETLSSYRSSYGYNTPNCRSRLSFCNGNIDCGNKRDESYCDDYLTQFNGGCPSDWWKCKDGRCIPSEWECNGYVDCKDESDESECSYLKRNQVIITQVPPTITSISAREGRTLGDGLAKKKLIEWFMSRRKNETATNKWGHELPRIAVALFLAEREFFEPGNRTMEEMNYELTIQLLSQIAGGGSLKRKDLSLYIHALMVTCVDPRNFHGRDLVSELRSIVDSGNETVSSFDLLVLCNAGDTMTDKDAEKITAAFDSQHRPFWTDNQAMATLALACISSSPGVKVDERTVIDMAQELKKRQFRNGTVDNLKTTALVIQALIATHSLQRDFNLDAALRVIQNAQREDGSIGSFLDSYYILPVLSNSSLLNVTSNHCKRPTTSEAEALNELQGARGQRLVIQFSVWIGSEVDLKRTWTLKVPANSSLYYILETVNRLDTKQQVLYNVLDGKPYVSSLMGLQDDVETGVYWFTYVRHTKDADPTLVEESPVDVKIRPNEELILWYKSGQWNKVTPELTTQS